MEWVLEWRSPWLTTALRGVTDLGSEGFFLAALPLGYWLDRRGRWARVGLMFMLAAVLNAALKDIWQAPRPMLAPLVEEGGFSFPSGHAMISTAFWGWLAVELRRRWFTALAVLVIAAVMFSRVYLGVHWPRDVLGGAGFGALLIALGHLFIRADGPRRVRAAGPLVAWLPAGLVVLGAALLPDPEQHGLKSAAAMAGLWAGVLWLEGRAIPPVRRGRAAVGAMLAAALVGFAVLLGIWAGGKKALVALDLVNTGTAIARYGLVGLWAAGLAPWVFDRLKLTAPAPAQPTGGDRQGAGPT